jgi:hypothetical protein
MSLAAGRDRAGRRSDRLGGAAFGFATARLAARRLAAWREGRSVRPALWVAFVALFAIAWEPGSLLPSLVLALLGAALG